MRRPTTWILIADGARARVLVNRGPGTGLEPALDGELCDPVAQAHISDVVSDRAGRTFDSTGEGRHGYEPNVDPKRQAKLDFARSLARLLEDASHRRRFDQLILAAPPKALGDLRDCLSKNVAAKVVRELPKDLVNVPKNDLAGHLDGVIRL